VRGVIIVINESSSVRKQMDKEGRKLVLAGDDDDFLSVEDENLCATPFLLLLKSSSVLAVVLMLSRVTDSNVFAACWEMAILGTTRAKLLCSCCTNGIKATIFILMMMSILAPRTASITVDLTLGL
jgi:hypothetical protein